MTILKFLQEFFGMTAKEFLAEWKALSTKDQDEIRELGRGEAARQGVTLTN